MHHKILGLLIYNFRTNEKVTGCYQGHTSLFFALVLFVVMIVMTVIVTVLCGRCCYCCLSRCWSFTWCIRRSTSGAVATHVAPGPPVIFTCYIEKVLLAIRIPTALDIFIDGFLVWTFVTPPPDTYFTAVGFNLVMVLCGSCWSIEIVIVTH